MTDDKLPMPVHPFWCDTCGMNAPFTIPECPINHEPDCPRHGEDARTVYLKAVEWCKRTGGTIP